MDKWELRDIDIWREIDPLPVVQAGHPSTEDEMLPVYRAIATAAVRKVVGIFNERFQVGTHTVLIVDIVTWTKLKQEVGL